MQNPTYPENIAEIPNITFYAVKDSCNETGLSNDREKSITLPQKVKLEPSEVFNSLLEDCGVDYIG